MQGVANSPYVCKRCGTQTVQSNYIVDGRPRCKNCTARNGKLYRKRHPEKTYHIKKQAEYRRLKREPDLWARRAKMYRLKYPHKEAEKKLKRLLWIRHGTVTIEQLRDIYVKANGCCAYCGQVVSGVRLDPIYLTGFDHIIPKPFGGNHEASNLTLCCRPCNVKKGRSHNGQMPKLRRQSE